VEKTIERLAKNPKTDKNQYDVDLLPPLHQALSHLPAAVKLDMRMWQWLAIKRLPHFVWRRWNDELPDKIEAALARPGLPPRFLGSNSLRGRHRNALSRLFFAAEMLRDKKEGYMLATSAFQMQDRHTSLFEREMGLVPAAAKALIRLTNGMSSKEIQRMAKRLNNVGSALVFEFVEEQQLVDLLK
jgi:hypothetical protein